MRILFTGGGTGGHFFPLVSVARELKKIAEDSLILDLELYYMGPDDFSRDLLKQEGIVEINIVTGKLRRYFSFGNILDFFKIAIGVVQAFWNFFLVMPDVVFSKGGYGALPAVIASFVFRIPLVIHESDSVPGRVNQFSAKFAHKIAIAFKSAYDFFPKNKTALVGIPIRKRILGEDISAAKESLEINSNLPVISFIGASQGSQRLNEAVLGVLKDLTEEFEILHQTGLKNFTEVRGEAEIILESSHKERYHPFGFLDENKLREFYSSSDLIVSRAGASSIFEIAAWGKPSILVPLGNAAQDHQRKNAYEYAASGAALIIEENNITPHVLLGEVRKALSNKELLRKMSEAAQKFARIDSADIIAREVLKLAEHK